MTHRHAGSQHAPRRRWLAPFASIAGLVALAVAAPVRAQQCTGDCGYDGTVTIEEVIQMVGIGLGTGDVQSCLPGDANGDGEITVDEIVKAVDHALTGCPTTPCDPAAGMADCQSDTDCVVISEFGCCPCWQGGAQGAINAANQWELALRRAACCGAYQICLEYLNCDDTLTARCDAGTCQLVRLPTPTPLPSPTPTPEPIAARHCKSWTDCTEPLKCIPETGGICFGGPVCAGLAGQRCPGDLYCLQPSGRCDLSGPCVTRSEAYDICRSDAAAAFQCAPLFASPPS